MFSNTPFNILPALLFLCACNSAAPETKLPPSPPMDPTKAVLEYKTNAKLGEGALWNFQTQEFYWVDIEGKMFHIYNPKTKANRSFPTPSRVGTVVPSGKDEALLALEDGIYKINTQSGEIKPFSPVEKELTQNRFNDGKCDPAGNLWVGSMHLEQSAPEANLWKISPDGNATKMLDSITISNGIVWTKDKKTMYYIDTPTGLIRAFDYDVNAATISNERTAVVVPTSLGYPDGMAIDAEDKLWVGLWNGDAVARFDPTTGKLISKIDVPAHNVTACAFGGANLDTLYITTASVDMTEEEKGKFPDAGSLFMAVPGVRGQRSVFFGQQ
jgi:sugar lactone lactonase YvrE